MTDNYTLQEIVALKAQTLTPKRVVLCGSTRFSQAFQDVNLQETLNGHIVLSIGCDTKSDHELALSADKVTLDLLHLYKIDLADEVIILNVGGYIGLSTAREIEYALMFGKPLRFLEPCVLAVRRGLAWVRAADVYIGRTSVGRDVVVAGDPLRAAADKWRVMGEGGYVNVVYDPENWLGIADSDSHDAWFFDQEQMGAGQWWYAQRGIR